MTELHTLEIDSIMDWKRDNIWQFIGVVVSIIALLASIGIGNTIIVVIILLFTIAALYYTGRLEQLKSFPTVTAIFDNIRDKVPEIVQSIYSIIISGVFFFGILIIPLAALTMGFMMLFPEPRQERDQYYAVFYTLLWLTLLATFTIRKPMNGITAFSTGFILSTVIILFAPAASNTPYPFRAGLTACS